jgi:Uma2 family endonuclease
LSRDEFERRYEAMPHVKKAELIEGVVYMPSPVSSKEHGDPHFVTVTWLGVYSAKTPGVEGSDNATIKLDWDNEPQPDAHLRIPQDLGGQTRLVGKYLEGPPELALEVAASSASYDLHEKLNAYRRSGIREYLVWRVLDKSIDWFVLRGGQYERLSPGADGIYRSEVFPGLWLDAAALIRRDLGKVLDVLQSGLTSDEHTHFVESLNKKP